MIGTLGATALAWIGGVMIGAAVSSDHRIGARRVYRVGATITLLALALAVLTGCAAPLLLSDGPQLIQPGERVTIAPDGSAWRDVGPDLSGELREPFGPDDDLRDPRTLAQYGGKP